MQRSDSYRVHLSVLALAIAACSSGVQAQALDASNAAGQRSPISPAATPADASGDAGDAETPAAAANASQTSSEASNQDLPATATATATATSATATATPATATAIGTGAASDTGTGKVASASPSATAGVQTLDAMQVTGVRRANAAAVESKRAATNITDVISATDVRALPDSTIVEALRRVPGLSVLPATDNEHPRDEAATPVLRGLGPSYNNVTIDGLTIASPGTPNGTLGSITRGVRLDLLPASMVSELQVVKTFTADLDPN
ncbi:TonB-dependent receptor plug domain-containing protein, partial [Xanthomonas campestris pv. campestris]|nr:TonB-dependent receptor plug domain-containing protein [Xanthomonas campestris pv. campestris]